MAVIGGTALTLADWAKRLDDRGKIAGIVELLSQTNEVIDDALFVEANSFTGHRTTVRTGLPQGTWRLLNYGVQPTKSTTAQITATCGNLEAYSEVDKDLADLANNKEQLRMSEAVAFMEGMNQQVAQMVFYGNEATNPERFTGLSPRYNTVNTATAQTANNVLDAGGTGSNNTSIWIVSWGENTVHGIFPKGKLAGLQHRDLGEDTLFDANGGRYQGYRDHFKWEIGMAVRDWRYCVRVANVDVTLLNGGSAANLINLLIRAFYKMPTAPAGVTPIQSTDASTVRGGRTIIYCNKTIRTYLDLQAMNKSNVLLQLGEVNGRPGTTFRGVPIRTVDQLLNTEARVV